MQLTPPGSECSIIIGNGITSAAPGSVQGPQLVDRGADVGVSIRNPNVS